MALTYGQILNQAALRLGEAGSIVGSNMTTVESNYNNASFGAAQIDNPRFPFSAQKDALQMAEEKIVQVIADNPNHVDRIFISAQSANIATLANRASLPSADNLGNKRVGQFGSFKDVSNNTILTRLDIDEIERLIRLKTNGVLAKDYYYFDIVDNKIVHTRTAVYPSYCIYSKDTQKNNIANNLTCLLPDSYEHLYMCGELYFLFAEDEAPATIKHYIDNFADWMQRQLGGTNV